MKKAVSQRIKITKTGKLIHRPMGVGHFKAKKNADQTRNKRKFRAVNVVDIKMFRKYLTSN